MIKTIQSYPERFIGYLNNGSKGPTVVIFGGIHGNEKAGVLALEHICEYLGQNRIQLQGNFYAIKGNLKALMQSERFIDMDLNRLWTTEIVEDIMQSELSELSESSELIELHEVLKQIFRQHTGPFYFLDIHTTSSYSVPFITISDSLNNRRFASKFKIPTVLGIEEFIEGPVLTFLNEYGHISLGFEAGQHDEESSVVNSIDFIWKALRFSKCLQRKDYKAFKRRQFTSQRLITFYHITYRYEIAEGEAFTMLKGYSNFGKIKKGTRLAFSNGSSVESTTRGMIFMPLYQKQGEDGFFIIRKISMFWMGLSILLRKLQLHFLLRLLPGIIQEGRYSLKVNPKIVLFFGNQIFHLLGYRKKIKKGEYWYYTRRDRKVSALV